MKLKGTEITNPAHRRILAHGVRGGDGPDGDTAVEDRPPAATPAHRTIERLVAERVAPQARIDEIIAAADGEERTNFTEAEETELRDLLAQTSAIDERIGQLNDADVRAGAAAEAAARVEGTGSPGRVRREPRTYDRHNRRQRSFFLDLCRTRVLGDEEAASRLQRHRQEVAVDLAERDLRDQRAFERWVDAETDERTGIGPSVTRDLSGADTAGGEFVPPLWLLDEAAELARAGRPVANAVRNIPLPPGTDSISVPKITTGTNVASQDGNNAAVAEQDMVTATATAPVRTLAGQEDVPLQLLEQSPIAFDEIVFADLIADYNAEVDAQVINGTGANGQMKGMLQATGITTVTYTDATPTVAEAYPKFADAINQAGTNRKLPPTMTIAHLRRWMWMAAALDTTGRPLVVPVANGPANAVAVQEALETEGFVGSILGPRLIVDLNVPTNLGAGTNEDRVITTRGSDHLLFEGRLRTRVLPEVGSGTLTVRLQVYAYAAFTAERFPSGIAVIAGTGLITPTF